MTTTNFYRPPTHVETETSIEISAEDEGEIVKCIDVLVVQHQFWLLVIEAKNADFSRLKAIPQALTYRTHKTSFTVLRYSYGKSHIQQPCCTLAA